MSLLYKAVASQVVMLKLYLSSDHVTAATGKTVAITISKNGGAFANPNAGATNATEVSNGWYKVTLDATDSATEGDLVVRGTATACDDTERVFRVHLPANFGVTSIDSNGRVDVIKVAGTTQTAGDLAAMLTIIDDLIDTEMAAVLGIVGTTGVVVDAASKTGYRLSATGVDDAWDEAIEGAYTARQLMRGIFAALLNILAGAATTTVTIRDIANTKNRVSATVDADGNRSAVTLDLT